jgi:hypothetical protein
VGVVVTVLIAAVVVVVVVVLVEAAKVPATVACIGAAAPQTKGVRMQGLVRFPHVGLASWSDDSIGRSGTKAAENVITDSVSGSGVRCDVRVCHAGHAVPSAGSGYRQPRTGSKSVGLLMIGHKCEVSVVGGRCLPAGAEAAGGGGGALCWEGAVQRVC